MRQVMGDLDPASYAGEGFTATEEIARPNDITDSPHLKARVGNEGAYWPEADKRNWKR